MRSESAGTDMALGAPLARLAGRADNVSGDLSTADAGSGKRGRGSGGLGCRSCICVGGSVAESPSSEPTMTTETKDGAGEGGRMSWGKPEPSEGEQVMREAGGEDTEVVAVG